MFKRLLLCASLLLACGWRRAPAPIGPDPTPPRKAAPPARVVPLSAVGCVLAEFTCSERAGENLAYTEIARRCQLEPDDAVEIGKLLDMWLDELYAARCAQGVLLGH